MSEELPKWPDFLPLPTKLTAGPKRVHLLPEDFSRDHAIDSLLHDLYWFSDDLYYLFYSDELKLDLKTASDLEESGVVITETESYFYMHPKPMYERDFLQVLPHADYPAWRKDAAKGPIFCRALLSLDAAVRREMDFNESAARTRDAIANSENILEFKPNFYGIGLNLNSLKRRLFSWLKPK